MSNIASYKHDKSIDMDHVIMLDNSTSMILNFMAASKKPDTYYGHPVHGKPAHREAVLGHLGLVKAVI